MAILERPLFGDEARGRIKNTLVFLKRTANVDYTDEDPGERFIINALRAPRQAYGVEREEWKDSFRAAVDQWREFNEEEKAFYGELAEGLETAYNAFLRITLGPEEEMGMFDGPIMVIMNALNAIFTFTNPAMSGFLGVDGKFETPDEAFITQGPTAGFSYAITG